MKLKLSLDPNSIKEFFVLNVEKFIFGGVILCLLVFVQRASTRPVYTKTPEDLKRIADTARATLTETYQKPDEKAPDYSGFAEGIKKPVAKDYYKLDHLFDPPIFEQPRKRPRPLLVAPRDLRGTGGHGAVKMQPVAGGVGRRTITGQRWVVLTALIPRVEQANNMTNAFKDCQMRYPEKDVPIYFRYGLERAEVPSPAYTGDLDWEPIVPERAMDVIRRFGAGAGREVVPGAFLYQVRREIPRAVPLAFPLPPLSRGEWGAEAAHKPEIPLERELRAKAQRDRAEAMGGGIPGAYGEGPMGEMPMPGPGGVPVLPGGGEGLDLPGDEELGPAPDEAGPDRVGRGAVGFGELRPEDVEHSLFRFFDFDVEPGKYYVYRVKLYLLNPNYKVPVRFLETKELAAKWWVDTPWSEPCEVVGVPRDSELLAGTVSTSRWVTVEPKATVGVLYFDIDSGNELFKEFADLNRGQLLNFPGQDMPEPEQVGYYRPSMEGPGGRPGEEDEPEKMDLLTDAVLLDVSGGQRLPGRDRDLQEPARMLMLGPTGELFIQDELEDQEDYQAHKPEDKDATRPEGGIMPGEYYEGMDEGGNLGILEGEGPRRRPTRRTRGRE